MLLTRKPFLLRRDLRGWIVRPLLILLVCIPIGIFTGAAMQVEFLFW